MGGDRLRLDDQLCFALYAATNAVVRAYRPLLRELDLTYPQYVTLMALWEHGRMPVGRLASRVDLPPHGLGPVLRRLEKAGFVTRTRNGADGRSVLVDLTDRGRHLEGAAAEVQRQVVCATGLSSDDLADLRSRLHHLTEDMRGPASCPTTAEGHAS